MKRRIAALPVDGRPVVRSQVADIMAAAGWELVLPAVEELGHLREPADRDRLAEWLEAQAPSVDGLVLSLDMLVYGGLVPSRFIDDAEHTLRTRLDIVQRIRARNPGLPILGFASTMRISNNNVAEEEKPYWDRYGELFWRWSFHADRFALLGEPGDRDKAEAARAAIPGAVARDYLATRRRNFAVTRHALALTATGCLDRLILPQDDTADFGWNIAERRLLAAEVAELALHDKVAIYPGADEVLATLCANLCVTLSGARPRQVFLSFGDAQGAAHMTARYEDRPLLKTLDGQLSASGLRKVAHVEQAEVIVAVHTRGTQQGDWAMGIGLPEPEPVSETWIKQLLHWLQARRPLALLDLAYANGGDPQLIESLGLEHLARLEAYGAWNTAGNRSGMLFAQLSLLAPDQTERLPLLCQRLYEDFLWQAVLRRQVRAEVDEHSLSAGALARAVSATVLPYAAQWGANAGLPCRVREVTLPWDRTFEVDLSLERA